MHQSLLKHHSLPELKAPQEIILEVGKVKPEAASNLPKGQTCSVTGLGPEFRPKLPTPLSHLSTHTSYMSLECFNKHPILDNPIQISWEQAFGAITHSPCSMNVPTPLSTAACSSRDSQAISAVTQTQLFSSRVPLGTRPHRCKTFLLKNKIETTGFMFPLGSGERSLHEYNVQLSGYVLTCEAGSPCQNPHYRAEEMGQGPRASP